MFWSQFDEDEVNAAPGAWTHPAASVGAGVITSAGGGVTTGGVTAGIMLRDQAESKAFERVESKASGVQHPPPSQERDTLPQQERWGLDVTIKGISNQTDAMVDDNDDQYDVPVARPAASNTDATLLHPQLVTHNECFACLPPVWYLPPSLFLSLPPSHLPPPHLAPPLCRSVQTHSAHMYREAELGSDCVISHRFLSLYLSLPPPLSLSRFRFRFRARVCSPFPLPHQSG
jgi:hypothetical protein